MPAGSSIGQSFMADPSDGRTIGSLMVLQALVAQLIARHPDRATIMVGMANFSTGIHEQAQESIASGDIDAFALMNDMAHGMDDTLKLIQDYMSLVK